MEKLFFVAALSVFALQPAFADNLLNTDTGVQARTKGLLSGDTNVGVHAGANIDNGERSGTDSSAQTRSYNDNAHEESNSSIREKHEAEDNNVATRGSTTLDGDIGMPNPTYKGNLTSKGSIGVR